MYVPVISHTLEIIFLLRATRFRRMRVRIIAAGGVISRQPLRDELQGIEDNPWVCLPLTCPCPWPCPILVFYIVLLGVNFQIYCLSGIQSSMVFGENYFFRFCLARSWAEHTTYWNSYFLSAIGSCWYSKWSSGVHKFRCPNTVSRCIGTYRPIFWLDAKEDFGLVLKPRAHRCRRQKSNLLTLSNYAPKRCLTS